MSAQLVDSGAGLKTGQSKIDRQQWTHIQYQVLSGECRSLAVLGEVQSKSLQGIGDSKVKAEAMKDFFKPAPAIVNEVI